MHDDAHGPYEGGISRRGFLQASAAGLAAGSLAGSGLAGTALAEDFDRRHRRPPRGRRVLIKGGIVLTMDPRIGDFAQADVLIEGSKIVAVGPNIRCGGAGDRRRRHDRHAGVHQHAPPPVRDHPTGHHRGRKPAMGRCEPGVAAGRLRDGRPEHLDDGPDPDRQPGHLGPGAFPVRPRGQLHLRAGGLDQPDQSGRHDGHRHLTELALARAYGRHDRGADGLRTAGRCSSTPTAAATPRATSSPGRSATPRGVSAGCARSASAPTTSW